VWKDVFRQPNRSQAEWLNHFFTSGNCLCHPSILVRKNVFDKLGYYNPALRQLPDFEMWIRLAKMYPIHIIERDLVEHLRSGSNTSVVSQENTKRNLTELVYIFRHFLDGIGRGLFIDAFKDKFRTTQENPSDIWLECEKVFLLMDWTFIPNIGKAVAVETLMQGMGDPSFEDAMLHSYKLPLSYLYQMTAKDGFGTTFVV
jgi:hypothetical protein